ncbi:hypothetical protein GCM10027037_22590 [Mucilaginibacter koreensis]
MAKLNTLLKEFIQKAKAFGLPEQDCLNAHGFLTHNEQKLAFDTIVTQLYEYEIKVDEEFLHQATLIASLMLISPDDYAYLKELVKVR